MKFFNLKSMIGMFLILFMAACQDDTGSGAKVEEGLAAKLNLSIQVPAVEEVNTRAIADNESQINELALFMYSVNSDLYYRVDLTGKLTEEGKATANGYRSYTVNEVPVQTGTFTIYAVANWSSRFANCNLSDDISEEQLKAMMGNGDDVYQLQPGDYLPMTDIVKDVTFYTGEEATKNELHLSLKRTTARIEFTIQDGEKLEAVNGHFTPTSYKIFSLPKASYLFDAGQATIENLNTYNVGSIDLTAGAEATTFEFLMNENVQPAGQNIKEYQDREIYEGNWTNPTSFKNAPEGSTYVVINGYYRDNSQSGPVSYRIHLGNFSNTGSITNFTVNRNEQHLYKVTVNGIDNISTEAEVKNPGAYGDVEVRALQFTSEPTIQDAHYVIYPIDIKAENVSDGKLTSNVSWLTLRTNLTDLEEQGYWIEDDRGTQSIDIPNGTTRVYAFLEENVGEVTREATLSLYQEAYSDFKEEFVVQQYPVSWNGNIGCERIEDGTYPWGFMWPEGTSVTYELPGYGDLLAKWWASLLLDLTGIESYPYVDVDRPLLSISSVTINFDKLNATGVAASDDDGKANTNELYNYQGINDASNLIAGLEGLGLHPDKELPLNPTEFAARACMMKNKFTKIVKTEGDNRLELPVLRESDIVWYLPARNEAPSMVDSERPLSGDYWTSTAAPTGNENAYKFTAGTSSADQLEHRNTSLNVRAVRKR